MNAPAHSSVYQEIAAAIGEESAQRLVKAFSGVRVFVPETIDSDHEIARAIGVEAARRLASFYGRTRINLPVSGARRHEVKKLGRSGGLSRQKIARSTGYSERQVYRILGEEDDPRQGKLFGEEDEV